jgi:hypothetical protein
MEETGDRPSYEPADASTFPPEPTAKISSFQRLVKMFYAPGEVFDDIEVKPTWLLVLAASLVVVFAVVMVTMSHIDIESTMRENVEKSGREMTDEQIEQAMVFMDSTWFKYIQPGAGALFYTVGIVLLAVVFFLGLKLAGSETSYSRILSSTAHAYWPATVASCVLGIVVISQSGTLTGSEAQSLIKSNLSAFLSPETPNWILVAARSLDLFNIWIIALTIVGLSVTSGVSRKATAVVVGATWIAYLTIKVAWTAIFG